MKKFVSVLFFGLLLAVTLSAADKAKSFAIAGTFTTQKEMRRACYASTPTTTDTVCKEHSYPTRVECKSVTREGTPGGCVDEVAKRHISGTLTIDGKDYVVQCTANWYGSECRALQEGQQYEVKFNKKRDRCEVKVGKITWMKLDVIGLE